MRESTLRASVVVPTYRRDDFLARCLESLYNQSFMAEEYEVLVADDAASPLTNSLVQEFERKSKCAVRYVPVNGMHGPAAARNAGWRQARGAIVAFTDDDCIPDVN